MIRTRAELRRIAEMNVNGTLAHIMMEFPSLKKAIDKIPAERWREALDERYAEVTDYFMTKFGVSD